MKMHKEKVKKAGKILAVVGGVVAVAGGVWYIANNGDKGPNIPTPTIKPLNEWKGSSLTMDYDIWEEAGEYMSVFHNAQVCGAGDAGDLFSQLTGISLDAPCCITIEVGK